MSNRVKVDRVKVPRRRGLNPEHCPEPAEHDPHGWWNGPGMFAELVRCDGRSIAGR